MVVYDVECRITFDRPLEATDRTALKDAIGGKRGWHGPLPVVTWGAPNEAIVFMVMRAAAPDEEDPETGLCPQARSRVEAWVQEAGLADATAEDPPTTCTAVPRL